MKKTFFLILIPLLFIGCCKYDCYYLDITNETSTDKIVVACIIVGNDSIVVSDKADVEEDFNRLGADDKTQLVFTAEESSLLKKKPEEKNLFVYYYNSEKDSKDKVALKKNDIRNYCFEELEELDWKISFNYGDR